MFVRVSFMTSHTIKDAMQVSVKKVIAALADGLASPAIALTRSSH
jgi:hypothetical protein